MLLSKRGVILEKPGTNRFFQNAGKPKENFGKPRNTGETRGKPKKQGVFTKEFLGKIRKTTGYWWWLW